MRNLIQPIIKEIGTITRGGFEYHYQTISYGSHHHIHVFRKQAPHKRGIVFETRKAFEEWSRGMKQLTLDL
jgi:hypothetical protein